MATFTKRSNGNWQAKIRRDRWPEQSRTFKTKTDAVMWARAIEREMDLGTFVERREAEKTTFREAAERYKREVLALQRGQAQAQYVVNRVIEEFGDYSLSSISSALISAYRDRRLKCVSAQTVVHELGIISRVFKACKLDWGIAIPQGVPTDLVRKPKLANSRQRRLEGPEEALLLEMLKDKPFPRAAVILAIETAARQSELISLSWSDVDLHRRVARLRGIDGRVTKSGDTFREVPLTSRAVETLSALPRPVIGGRVFPISQNALHMVWDRVRVSARRVHLHQLLTQKLEAEGIEAASEIRALIFKKRQPLTRTIQLMAELERTDLTLVDLHFHDLRHEATSRLAEKLQTHELMKVTGHKSSTMLSRYYHPRAQDLALKLA